MDPSPGKNITVVDVARAAKVSASTAAGALRNAPSVNPSTRDRVKAIAAKLGYRPNMAASVLAARRARGTGAISLAYLTHFPHGRGLKAFTTAQELARLCTERGWIFAHHNLTDVAEVPALARQLEARGVEVVILGASAESRLHTTFPWDRFVCLCDQRDRVDDGFDVVRPNYFGCVENLLHGLRLAGFKRIGFFHLNHDSPLQDDLARLTACLAFNETVRPSERASILKSTFRSALCGRAFQTRLRAWLKAEKPDVVVGTNNYCYAALETLSRGGFRPASVPFVALIVTESERTRVAGLHDARVAVAPLLLSRALEKLRLGQRGLSAAPLETVFRTEFLPGESLRRANPNEKDIPLVLAHRARPAESHA